MGDLKKKKKKPKGFFWCARLSEKLNRLGHGGTVPPPKMACSICHDAIDVDTTGRYETSCRHAFHLRCITKWYSANSTCPLCRKEAVALERIDESSEEEAESDDDELTDEMEREAEEAFLSFISQPLPVWRPVVVSSSPEETAPTWVFPPPRPSQPLRPLRTSPITAPAPEPFVPVAQLSLPLSYDTMSGFNNGSITLLSAMKSLCAAMTRINVEAEAADRGLCY